MSLVTNLHAVEIDMGPRTWDLERLPLIDKRRNLLDQFYSRRHWLAEATSCDGYGMSYDKSRRNLEERNGHLIPWPLCCHQRTQRNIAKPYPLRVGPEQGFFAIFRRECDELKIHLQLQHLRPET